MKIFNKISALVFVLAAVFMFSLTMSTTVLAATAPSLGAADSYAVFGKAGVTNNSAVGTTHIWGNVGADATNVTNLSDATQVDGIIDAGAGVAAAASAAYTNLDLGSQGVPTGLNLAGTNTVTPGVYTVGATTLNGTLTLDGAGVYIFRSSSSVSSSGAGTMSLINGATACNVFWEIPTSMTIGTGTHIEGTIIAQTGLISLATGATLKGRAISLISQVTMDSNQITQPVCATTPTPTPTPTQRSRTFGNINVVKTVINDNGGTKKVSDFPLLMNGSFIESGVTNSFTSPGVYTVTETSNPNYTTSFSGDCDINGQVSIQTNDNKFCIITNNDIGAPIITPPVPPILDLVKVPSPLSLPNGPGQVNYTYTLRNIGKVTVTDITMVGDTCRPINLVSGDNNANGKLEVNETWVYQCSTNLTETHTNTVVATGWANGISATDIASATVIVGAPVVPPLIHVTKVPSPLTLLAGGGIVTYTEKITNPGTVALNNVNLSDDKCSPLVYVLGGDINQDSKLDTNETWTYTCKSNLTQTTINTAVASGAANGLSVRDFAITTVVVADAIPSLPKTGFNPNTPAYIIVLAGIIALVFGGFALRRRIV